MANYISVWKRVGLIATLFFVLFTLATGVKYYFNLCEISNDQKSHLAPSESAEEAANKGTLVCSVVINPERVVWHGQVIEFKEAWIEERVSVGFSWVWFREYQRLGDFHLCFTLSKGKAVFSRSSALFFPGESSSSIATLTNRHRILFFEIIPSYDFASKRMKLMWSWNDTRPRTFVFTLQKGK